MTSPKLVSAGVTHAGRVRTHNEDAFLDAPARNLWVVADGMGGHSAGDFASRLIVERLALVPAAADPAAHLDAVDAQLSAVNEELRRHAAERKVSLIGATVVAMISAPDFMLCGWAGDSRIYRYRDGQLSQLTRDHSTHQEMMDTGVFSAEQLTGKQTGNTITRAVGGEPRLFLDWVIAEHAPGTQFVLCSDGLTKEVAEARIAEELARGLPAQQTAENLVAAALAAGGRDNVTVVVVRAERA